MKYVQGPEKNPIPTFHLSKGETIYIYWGKEKLRGKNVS